MFVVDVANIEDDEGSEDDIVGTIKNLSADEIASGFDNIVFVMPDSDDTEEAPDDAEIWLDDPGKGSSGLICMKGNTYVLNIQVEN